MTPFVFHPCGGSVAVGVAGGDEFLSEGFVVSRELDDSEAGGDRKFFDEFYGFKFDFIEWHACFFGFGFNRGGDIEHEEDALAIGLDS
jgi:hypothetical protein